MQIMEKGQNGRPRQFNIIATGANVSDLSIMNNDRTRLREAEDGSERLLRAQILTGNHSLTRDEALSMARERGWLV